MWRIFEVALPCALLALSFNAEPALAGDAETIVSLERAALQRWAKGDLDGFLELSDEDLTYFDPFIGRRLEGKQELRALYAPLRGTFTVARFEMLEPKVQLHGDIAVLTFRFISEESDNKLRWNTTEVYRRTSQGWRIIHTHWSLAQAEVPKR